MPGWIFWPRSFDKIGGGIVSVFWSRWFPVFRDFCSIGMGFCRVYLDCGSIHDTCRRRACKRNERIRDKNDSIRFPRSLEIVRPRLIFAISLKLLDTDIKTISDDRLIVLVGFEKYFNLRNKRCNNKIKKIVILLLSNPPRSFTSFTSCLANCTHRTS